MDTLRMQCNRLEESLESIATSVEEFSSRHTTSHANLEPLVAELSELRRSTAALRDKAASFDDGATPIPDDVFRGIKMVPANCVDHVLAARQTLEDPTRQRHDWQGIVPMDVDRLVRPLETGRRALDVAVAGLDMATGVNEAEQTGDSPPYATTSIVPEILYIKVRLAEDRDRNANTVQAVVLTEFLEALQRFASQHSGNLVPPPIEQRRSSNVALSEAASLPGGSGRGSGGGLDSYQAPDDSTRAPSPGLDGLDAGDLGRPTPAYSTIRLPPAPQRMDLRHVSRLPTLESETLGIAFDATARVPRVAVTTYHHRVRFFHMKVPEGREQMAGRFNLNGTSMCLSPAGPLMAVVQEHLDSLSTSAYERLELSRRQAGSRETLHDGRTFLDPEVVVFDYAKQTYLTKHLRWPGARPFAFSPSGALLAVRGVLGRVEVWDVAGGGKGVGVVRSHTEDVFEARFTAEGDRLVTMSRDGTLRVTSTTTWRGTAKLEVAEWKNPVFLAVSVTGSVVTSVWGRKVYLWDPDTGALDNWSLDGPGGEGWPLAASPDLRFLCCRTENGADVRDMATGRVLCRMGFGQGFASSAAFSLDSKYLTVGRAVGGHHVREALGRVDFWEIIE
ncbi:hypothetical protein VDGE_09683 [Verticillium dahliae]|uniref:Uncharacterized protein n=1 Tax=Verticillium dahliae TaxID=27337 RepID=A0A444S783_VERDA|nr:hypothetical protein VDGE_09683 [Verticillium dahliae]